MSRPIKLEDAEPAVAERWREVLEHQVLIADALADDVDEGFVVLQLDFKDADKWGVYPILSISDRGTIAEYSVNMPFHYPTFSALLTAASVRTASS